MKLTNLLDIQADKYYFYYFESETGGKIIRLFKCLQNPTHGRYGTEIKVKEVLEIHSTIISGDRKLDIENDWDGFNYTFIPEDQYTCLFWELTDLEIITHIMLEDI